MPIADKMNSIIEASSFIRKMFEEGARLKAEFGADNVYDFSLGNPDIPPPPQFDNICRELLEDKTVGHGYMANAGWPQVRQAVADHLTAESGVTINMDQVIMTTGAAAALNVAFKALLNPGEEVMCPAPYFVEYGQYAANHGGVLKTVPTKTDFHMDIEAMEAAMGPLTRVVLINSPNNPTGVVYTAEELTALAEMMERASAKFGKRIYLVSDEPYRYIAYDVTVPPVLNFYPHTIILASHSKDLSLAGERIGYMAVSSLAEDSALLGAAMVIANRILGFVNAPSLMQRVVGRLQGITVDVSIYQRRRDLLCRGLAEIGYEFQVPQGAFYLFPKSPLADDVAFAALLKEERVLVVPGSGFGGPGYFRISYAVPDSVISGSMEGFKKALEKV